MRSSSNKKKGFGNTSKENHKGNSLKYNDAFNQEQEALEFIKEGKLEDAEEIYKQLIKLGTKNHKIYGNLAALYGMKGDKNEMYKLLRKAIEIEPNFPEAHNNLGTFYSDQCDYDQAIEFYLTSLKINPKYAEAYNNLGTAQKGKGNADEAMTSFKNAIKLKPDYPEPYFNLADIYKRNKEFEIAKELYIKAIKIRPNFVDAYNNIGLIYHESGNYTEAINYFKKALTIDNLYLSSLINLSLSLKELRDFDSAITICKKAIDINKNQPDIYYNMGKILQAKGDLYDSAEAFRIAIKLRPSHVESYYNLALLNSELGEIVLAIKLYKEAIKINPEFYDAVWNLSLLELLVGDYSSGWESYKYRWKKNKPPILHGGISINEFSGEDIFDAKNLLIIAEQGLGDTLQYMRYIPYLINKGINISFCAQESLHKLIKESNIHHSPIKPKESNLITSGEFIPLLSLPKYLGIKQDNVIIYEPYIKSSTELTEKWKKIISKREKPIIGINWQGNPKMENTYKGRSLPLEVFGEILKSNSVELLSLQKGYGFEQLETCSFKDNFVECQQHINETWDFLETASIINNCDLIITCDTAMAHLAGGMGKPVWLLLKDIPFWTWGMQGEKTFWYPSMKLFRQNRRYDWEELIKRVSLDLKTFLYKISNDI